MKEAFATERKVQQRKVDSLNVTTPYPTLTVGYLLYDECADPVKLWSLPYLRGDRLGPVWGGDSSGATTAGLKIILLK
ncbi:hypothetical protein AG1IA_07175 [Rhizoctonia solani AG-1 IA]|uniref:Uncharacterized protein n=1 Tax=Thanatephorus cucumeris (strain AG1-IA) TaxID=983506 RepID=L8WPW4_THACA|nr:hypothetical protein AG1IA_07175 [Rhizoctonia solani AG-1 IA]